jgi:RNA polymerase sigma-70 factor (ECF subfamily)
MRDYQDMVFTTAARLSGNDSQAEDIAQEVFVRAYQNFESLRTSGSAGGWLKTVATNLAINHHNRYRRRWRFFSELRRVDAESDDEELEWQGPDDLLQELSDEERRERVDAALKRLPDAQRIPLVLFHFEELPYQDIADRLNVSLAKVKTDIRRGRATLATLLQADI